MKATVLSAITTGSIFTAILATTANANAASFIDNAAYQPTLTNITTEGTATEQIKSVALANSSSVAASLRTGTVNYSFSDTARSSATGSGYSAVIYDSTAQTPRRIPESSMVLGLGLIAVFGLLSPTKSAFNKL
ncbi:hypothetical protein ACE1CI_03775 [Aerosakkonemataceae cyanobacterium BLCC-F50]|uniref:PEP-CTERM sorting domain-containing protein n=1 Tax=Floridaenema flaviceps BLCC-F50 TaxID=3153642 RepID=A0ABV4XK17_9CYAN